MSNKPKVGRDGIYDARQLGTPKMLVLGFQHMYANDEPRNAGTLNLVRQWNKRVPKPAKRRVVEILKPVRRGTVTVRRT